MGSQFFWCVSVCVCVSIGWFWLVSFGFGVLFEILDGYSCLVFCFIKGLFWCLCFVSLKSDVFLREPMCVYPINLLVGKRRSSWVTYDLQGNTAKVSLSQGCRFFCCMPLEGCLVGVPTETHSKPEKGWVGLPGFLAQTLILRGNHDDET